MQRCILCGRKISNSTHSFGLGCLKKMSNSIGIYDIKNLKGESLLDRKILRICGKRGLLKEQRQLLTDRYLTLNLLNEVPLTYYDSYKNMLQQDISNINRNTDFIRLHSYNMITLKQSSEINKTYKKYESTFQKIMNGEYDVIQNISFDIVRFAFSRYYNNKPYLSDLTQLLQYYILKCGVLGLKMRGYQYSSEFLNYSLQENPEDITITEGAIVDDIKANSYFKDKVNEIIQKYKKKFSFNTENESFSFEEGDLFYSLHSTSITLQGKKIKNKWNLDITLFDRYDFTDLKEIKEYITDENFWKGLFGSTGNNLAMLANSCKVVNEYNVTIKFQIEGWEG